jgi:AcrR family transcriptional regulator
MSSAVPRAHSADSRDEILRAARHLFESRGFHETSMSEVAREAKVSKALIFWHFKTKEELFLAVLGKLLEPYYIDFAQEARELDERAQLERLIESYLLFVRDNASSVRFFLARLLRDGDEVSEEFTSRIRGLYDGYRALLMDLIRRAQEKGLCVGTLKPEATSSMLLAALNGMLVELLFMQSADFDLKAALGTLRGMLFGDAQHNEGGGLESGRTTEAAPAAVVGKENV